MAVLDGFTLLDRDMGSEVVRVDVETTNGVVTLNRGAVGESGTCRPLGHALMHVMWWQMEWTSTA